MAESSLTAGRSYDDVSRVLLGLLTSGSTPVVALSGMWGTGKTHLWWDVDNKLIRSKCRWRGERIYTSLFGLRGLEELKWRLIENIAQQNENAIKRTIKGALGAAKHVAASAHWSGKLAEYAASIVAPKLIENKLIVLDDLERAAHVDIGELLGFISEYSETNKTRFLVILNIDALDDRESWNRFREKVVDVELTLMPSTEDAYKIAAGPEDGPYRSALGRLVDVLQINNIRVIQRILRLVDVVLKDRPPLPLDIQGRVLPTLVLYPAVFYKAVSEPPAFEELVKFDVLKFEMARAENPDAVQEHQRIAKLLQSIGIVDQDNFELEIARALISGIPNEGAIAKILDDYGDHRDKLVLSVRIDDFFYALDWDPKVSRAASIEELRSLEEESANIDPVRLTRIAQTAETLGEKALGDRMVRQWIANFEKNAAPMGDTRDDFFPARQEQFNPEIRSAFDQMRRKQKPPPTPIEAILEMVELSGFGDRQTAVLQLATSADFEGTLENLSRVDLHRVFRRAMNWLKVPAPPENEYFNIAAASFLEACQRIVASQPDSKIAGIIRREFQGQGLVEKLDGVAPPNAPG